MNTLEIVEIVTGVLIALYGIAHVGLVSEKAVGGVRLSVLVAGILLMFAGYLLIR